MEKDLEKIKALIESLEEVNAKDIKIYHIENNPMFDYGIVATGASSRQGDGLVSKIYEKALEYDYKVLGAEGKGGDGWLLVDVGFAIVNLFTVEDRARYDLDKVWGHYNEIDPITFEEIK